MTNIFRSLLALCLLICGVANAAIPAAPVNFMITTGPVDLSVSGLHVSGNLILNGQGQMVSLRGVDKAGTEYMCLGQFSTSVFDGPSDATDVANLKAFGVNIVRLPINEQCWLGINGLPIANFTAAQYQNAIIAYVNLLTAANIATIIDLQWAAPGTHQAYPSPQALIPMPDADHAPAFWTSVANTFKNNSSVIFDLFNEPFPDNNGDTTIGWACLRDGCTQVYPNDSSNYTAVGMQSLVNTIRATGSTNVIMSPGLQFTNGLSQWISYKPVDPTGNLAAAWHSYAGQTCSNQSCFDSIVAPVLANAPLIAGEIGENDCQHIYVDPLMLWLDARNGNYLAWAWNTNDCSSFPAVISNYDGTPTSFGIGIRDHLLTMKGTTPPVPAPIPYFNNGIFPFGIAVGSNSNVTASDGTTYFADTPATGLAENMQFFLPFSTNDTITGTPDPNLYKNGRTGQFGTWTINVPNGNYIVTLGMAPNSSVDAGEFGQDQVVQGQQVGTCIWSKFSGTNISPTSGISCPANVTLPAPTVDVALTVSYPVSVFNQQLTIQPAASFGSGRTTILNTIKVVQQSVTTPPSAPTNVVATANSSTINLTWTASNGAITYNVMRSTSVRGFYSIIAGPSTNAYSDTNVVNGRTYYYIITAVNAAGISPKTAAVSATPTAQAPPTPTGVGATGGNVQVVVVWTASTGATSYNVKRSNVNGGPYSTVGSPTSTSFTDNNVVNGNTYYYVVTAVSAGGESPNSSQVSAVPNVPSPGTWVNVTPGNMDMTSPLGCDNFGTTSIYVDPSHPSNVYTSADCQGFWLSTDYGQTWTGPINIGTNGASAGNCAGGFGLGGTGGSPVIYEECIRGNVGLWKSIDGGVNWTFVNVSAFPSNRQDGYPPSVNPYNSNDLLIPGHEQNFLAHSTDGGSTWTSIIMPGGMQQAGGSALVFYIDTGSPATTANTWLWLAQTSGGAYGTWRTSNGGNTWVQVDKNEHPHGTAQIYQPNTSGVVYMAGIYSDLGWGLLRSTDYGQTWSHVGVTGNEGVAFGTPKNVYAMYGWSVGRGGTVDPNFEIGAQPGTSTFTQPGTPASLTQGPGQMAVTNDGTHNIIIASMKNAGVWRYVEP